ncbi:hypothetical protein [Mycolicibacterium komossense]|uniref:Uncharacterized protein n=1 Tax=Mycolicibacterium komossense TaxID=1779 RepID=A0ABT3C922_9MYCO|nr:hypothetical protein [Mycolicibacterium komossense]MCV7225911.1 hypothetical protein [Mycolicibacterium komossense]
MAFALKLNDLTMAGKELSDDDSFEFLADGILKVTEGLKVTYYGPGSWQLVQTLNDHRPGFKRRR